MPSRKVTFVQRESLASGATHELTPDQLLEKGVWLRDNGRNQDAFDCFDQASSMYFGERYNAASAFLLKAALLAEMGREDQRNELRRLHKYRKDNWEDYPTTEVGIEHFKAAAIAYDAVQGALASVNRPDAHVLAAQSLFLQGALFFEIERLYNNLGNKVEAKRFRDEGSASIDAIITKYIGSEDGMVRHIVSEAEQIKRLKEFVADPNKSEEKRNLFVNNIREKMNTKSADNSSDSLRDALYSIVKKAGYEAVAKELLAFAPLTQSQPQMTAEDKSDFLAVSEAHPWNSKSKSSASRHIVEHFEFWFARGLSIEDIEQAQPELIAEYKKEIVRNTRKRIKALTKPHQLPADAPWRPSPSLRRVAELSPDELILRRTQQNARKARSRAKGAKPS